jgi:hypothetical protein
VDGIALVPGAERLATQLIWNRVRHVWRSPYVAPIAKVEQPWIFWQTAVASDWHAAVASTPALPGGGGVPGPPASP